MLISVHRFVTNRRAGCDFKQRCNGQCCCSADMTLILGEIIRAEVSRGGKIVASKNIDVTHTGKLTSLQFVVYNVSKIVLKRRSVNNEEV